jgi:hypothetical protein
MDIAHIEKERKHTLERHAHVITSDMKQLLQLRTRWEAKHASVTVGVASSVNRMEGWPSNKKRVVISSRRNSNIIILTVTRNDAVAQK